MMKKFLLLLAVIGLAWSVAAQDPDEVIELLKAEKIRVQKVFPFDVVQLSPAEIRGSKFAVVCTLESINQKFPPHIEAEYETEKFVMLAAKSNIQGNLPILLQIRNNDELLARVAEVKPGQRIALVGKVRCVRPKAPKGKGKEKVAPTKFYVFEAENMITLPSEAEAAEAAESEEAAEEAPKKSTARKPAPQVPVESKDIPPAKAEAVKPEKKQTTTPAPQAKPEPPKPAPVPPKPAPAPEDEWV